MAKPEAEDDQDKRIENLKRRAEELSDGQMEVAGLDDCPAETEEAFWKQVVDYEEAPWTTHFQQLESAGVSLPSPDSLGDQELTAKLWEIIHKLALLRVFITDTDHLSDRELYQHLWADSLREETKMLPLDSNSAWHIQILGSGSEEDNQLYLKYYADDASRRQWQQDFPKDPLPAHEDPPTTVTACCPKRITVRPVAKSPTDALGHGASFCYLCLRTGNGVKEVDEGIWLVSFMNYDLGYIDLAEKTLQPLENPFGAKV